MKRTANDASPTPGADRWTFDGRSSADAVDASLEKTTWLLWRGRLRECLVLALPVVVAAPFAFAGLSTIVQLIGALAFGGTAVPPDSAVLVGALQLVIGIATYTVTFAVGLSVFRDQATIGVGQRLAQALRTCRAPQLRMIGALFVVGAVALGAAAVALVALVIVLQAFGLGAWALPTMVIGIFVGAPLAVVAVGACALAARFAATPAIATFEGVSTRATLARSWSATSGHVFAILRATFVLALAALLAATCLSIVVTPLHSISPTLAAIVVAVASGPLLLLPVALCASIYQRFVGRAR